LKYIFRQWNFSGPLISYCGPLILCHSALAHYKLYIGSWGGPYRPYWELHSYTKQQTFSRKPNWCV
jgi:hypothetical protein